MKMTCRARPTHLAFVVRRQPLVSLPLVVQYPSEVAVRPVGLHRGIHGGIVTIPDVVGDTAGVLTAVGALDDGLVCRTRHACRE